MLFDDCLNPDSVKKNYMKNAVKMVRFSALTYTFDFQSCQRAAETQFVEFAEFACFVTGGEHCVFTES